MQTSKSSESIKIFFPIFLKKCIKISFGNFIILYVCRLDFTPYNSDIFSNLIIVFFKFLIFLLFSFYGILGLFQLMNETFYCFLLAIDNVHQNQFLIMSGFLPLHYLFDFRTKLMNFCF